MTTPLRILFAASPPIAAPCLEALAAHPGVVLAGVLTNPDTPKGRRGCPEPTPIGSRAAELGVQPILKPLRLDAAARAEAGACRADLLVSFAYGRIFGPQWLGLFPRGGINVHPSRLPAHRGPTPIPGAIVARDAETGITIQTLGPEIDAGAILAQERFPLTDPATGALKRYTTQTLGTELGARSAPLLIRTLEDLVHHRIVPTPQTGEPTYTTLLTKQDGKIDWTQSAPAIDARIRAYTPWPGAWTTTADGTRIGIHEAQVAAIAPGDAAGTIHPAAAGTVIWATKTELLVLTGNGVLTITRLQREGRQILDWPQFFNGFPIQAGTQFT